MIGITNAAQKINCVHPVDKDRSESDSNKNRKRRVRYYGHNWEEVEEELPVQPKNSTEKNDNSDQDLLEKAHKLFQKMVTLEERVAQLCFYETQATYNTDVKNDTELLIQTWQIGGVVFSEGNYQRQAYLIERFQSVSNTSLLIANDFLHGLSFYLQGDVLKGEEISEQKCSDLGKAVMGLNRKIGVHIQFDQERHQVDLKINPDKVKAFRRGIRESHGIVGKEKQKILDEKPKTSSLVSGFQVTALPKLQVNDIVGFKTSFKTITFFDIEKDTSVLLEEKLYKAFYDQSDVFLIRSQLSQVIRIFCKMVRTGKITEEDLDRRVMKIMIIKSMNW